MVEQQPPSWLAAGCYTAQQDRNLFGDLICAEGVTTADALAVSAAGSMVVQVQEGAAWIEGTTVADQGMYRVYNDAPVELTLTASDPTDARIDLIVARVYDSAYTGDRDEWAIEVVQGTPAPSPVEPEIPDSSLVLARVNVPAGAGEITAADITDRRATYGLCVPEDPEPTVLTQRLAPTSAVYTGSITATRIPLNSTQGLVAYSGWVARASGSNNSIHSLGLQFQPGLRSKEQLWLPPQPAYSYSVKWQYRLETNGGIFIRQTGANPQYMPINATVPADNL